MDSQFEARKADLTAAVVAGEQENSLLRLHGNLSGVYRLRVGALREALAAGGNTEILETLRALVDRVLVHPSVSDALAPLELIGHLSALLEVVWRSARDDRRAFAGGWARKNPTCCCGRGLFGIVGCGDRVRLIPNAGYTRSR